MFSVTVTSPLCWSVPSAEVEPPSETFSDRGSCLLVLGPLFSLPSPWARGLVRGVSVRGAPAWARLVRGSVRGRGGETLHGLGSCLLVLGPSSKSLSPRSSTSSTSFSGGVSGGDFSGAWARLVGGLVIGG